MEHELKVFGLSLGEHVVLSLLPTRASSEEAT